MSLLWTDASFVDAELSYENRFKVDQLMLPKFILLIVNVFFTPIRNLVQCKEAT